MDEHNQIQKLLHLTCSLCEKYSRVYRGSINKERYWKALENNVISENNFQEKLIRENLAEHVGYLPIIASTIYPYLENKDEVDLGRVLTMLSIHDIGETVTGDIITYHKSDSDGKNENDIVKQILHPSYVDIYDEFEESQSYDAKFAKSVDKITPLIIDLIDLETNLKRWHFHNFSLESVIDKKRGSMQWDKTMLELFDCWAAEVYEVIQWMGKRGQVP